MLAWKIDVKLYKKKKKKIRLFADDSALYGNINTSEDSKILQEDLFKLQKWANTWQMNFNIVK